jgi:hypothetical protein
MLSICIKGGLGNQLFQYAFAKKMSIILNEDICLDLSWFYINKLQKVYLLNYFNLDSNIKIKKKTFRYYFENYIVNKIYIKLPLRDYRQYRFKDGINFINNYEKIFSKKNLYIMGYFQNEKYFRDIKETIRKDFKLNFQLPQIITKKKEEISNSLDSSCLIHLRRQHGSNQFENSVNEVEKFNNKDKDYLYYDNAIKFIKEKNKNTKFYLFTDVENEFTKKIANLCENFEYINYGKKFKNDLFEWEFMKSFSKFIIPNSTFSWWAAYLSDEKNPLVILPKDNYFINKVPEFPNSIKV